MSCPSSHPREMLAVSVLYSTSHRVLENTAVLTPLHRQRNGQMRNQVTFNTFKVEVQSQELWAALSVPEIQASILQASTFP